MTALSADDEQKNAVYSNSYDINYVPIILDWADIVDCESIKFGSSPFVG